MESKKLAQNTKRFFSDVTSASLSLIRQLKVLLKLQIYGVVNRLRSSLVHKDFGRALLYLFFPEPVVINLDAKAPSAFANSACTAEGTGGAEARRGSKHKTAGRASCD